MWERSENVSNYSYLIGSYLIDSCDLYTIISHTLIHSRRKEELLTKEVYILTSITFAMAWNFGRVRRDVRYALGPCRDFPLESTAQQSTSNFTLFTRIRSWLIRTSNANANCQARVSHDIHFARTTFRTKSNLRERNLRRYALDASTNLLSLCVCVCAINAIYAGGRDKTSGGKVRYVEVTESSELRESINWTQSYYVVLSCRWRSCVNINNNITHMYKTNINVQCREVQLARHSIRSFRGINENGARSSTLVDLSKGGITSKSTPQ